MADTTKDLAEVARAKAWLDMAQSKWRLQTLQHRSRYNPKTGVYRQLPTRIRRFLNGTPVGMKTLVLSLLKESAPYKSPVFDCETDDLLYRPTNTFIRKDGIEHTTGGKDPTYTIIQDLLLDDELGDTFMFGDESSCAQVGETEYHWDEPSVADCPDGAQGISYQVTDVSRDRETDLFSYRVRKVQALTVHVAPHVDDCDARRRVTTESWDNVYGEPGAFRWDSVRGGGAALPIPAPCEQPDGRSVKVDVYRNPDCTYRVTVQTVDAVTDPAAQYSIYRDQYKINASERVLNAFSPLPRAGVEYSGGVTTRYTSEHNEDGTWNNATEVETERPVPSSTVEVRRTPRGVLSSWVDTNQPRAASGISTQFGSWKSTKTPGGLFTNEYSEYTKQLIDNLGLVCNDTAFMKTHETQASVGEVPAGAHVPPAENGLVTTWNYDTDSEGFVTRRVRTEQEHTVEYAVRRRTWGYLGTTSGYLHRSVSAAYADQLYSSGETGTSVEVKLTNGGMYDVDVQTFLRVTGLRLGFECAKTVYQHMHEDVTSADAVGAEAQDAGGGHTYQRTFVVDTTTGAITRRDRDTTELHVPESRRTVRVTARGTVVRSTESNAAARPADAATPGQETEWEVTPGGRYNVTRTTTTPRTQENGTTCERDAFLHSDGSTDMRKNKPAGHVEGGSGGKYRERAARLGDDGLWEVTENTHTEQQGVDDGVDVVVTARGSRRTVKTRQTAKPQEPGVDDAGRALRTSRTRGGLYNVEDTTTTPRTQENGTTCEKDVFLHSDGTTDMRKSKPADHVDGGSGGIYRERAARLGDDGLWEVTENTHTEQQGVDDGVDVVVTARGSRKTVKTRQTAKPQEPGVNDAGRALRTSRTRGGLYNVEDTTTTPRTQENGATCEKDVFLHSDGSTDMRKNKPAGHVEGGSGGKYRERAARLGDDGLWEVTENTHTEQQGVDDGVDVVVTARGSRKTVKTRQTTKPREPSVDDAGRALRTSRTRGGLYNVEDTTTTPRTQENGTTCEKDLFLHSDGSTNMRENKPADHVDGGSGGKYRERAARLGDDGLWEVTENTHEERLVENSEERFTVTSRTWAKTTVTRNTDRPGEDPEPVIRDVGRRLVRSRTRGGLWNVEDTEFKPVEGDTAKACSRDLFLHTDITGHTAKNALDLDNGHLRDSDDMSGLYAAVRQRLGDDGLWDIENTANQENAVEKQRIDERVTRHGLVKRTTAVQVTREGNALRANQADMGKERVVEKTRGKRRNLTTVEITPFSNLKTAEACEKTAFLHTDAETWSRGQKPRDTHVDDAGDGVYREDAWTLTDLGTWEQRKTTHNELQPDLKIQKYEDAFGATTVTEEFSHNGEDGGQGGKIFDEETLIQSVEAQLTNGRRYTVRTKEETPTEVDSDWLHFEKTTSKGLAVFYDFKVFRNATMTQVKEWIGYIQTLKYEGWEGSFANHPSLNISPNRFRLWDGSISLTTTFTPKSWAAGGNTKEDYWESSPIEVVSVNFIPISQAKLLKVVTKETHVKGGGVGKDRMEEALAGGIIKGSQFAYHPSGQSYSYDLITKVETKGVVMDMPGAAAANMWNGTAL